MNTGAAVVGTGADDQVGQAEQAGQVAGAEGDADEPAVARAERAPGSDDTDADDADAEGVESDVKIVAGTGAGIVTEDGIGVEREIPGTSSAFPDSETAETSEAPGTPGSAANAETPGNRVGSEGSADAEAGEGRERAFARSRTPELPPEADISVLDPDVKQELRGLPKGLAEIVGRHLAAAGMLVDNDPELALEHARYARSKAARVAVVREAAGLTAYHAGEWSEALSELRAARRMSHGAGHVAVMADCERALGRPERAIELAREAQGLPLSAEESVELRIVAAGARRDMGQLDAAVVALQGDDLEPKRRDPWSARLFYAYADNLEAAGRTEEAVRWFLNAAQADDDNETDAAERAFDLSPQD
ncbi:tetratricopeptide repeat protein [Saccharothrix xinjiangensis]|uniref:Tetratricopeptide repeat protein n=1 Tax=Saccharothrix xinjiangensis TaxID=204798 RepID=A0ABV9YB89_9PSEU